MDRDTDPDPAPSTEEYPPGTQEYPPNEDDIPFWARLGFNSFEAYLDALDESQDILGGGPRVPARDVPAGDLLPEDGPELPAPPLRRVRQVNIKITDEGYAALEKVARSHGLAPATLARVLVARGVRALRGSR